ncbi:MAG: TetR/AcrR family transcriptional regulator [Sandaracinaceae bacterium]|nr:TetR/AcrR family transcriptional regulator [Sandaracinaceae bacterium]
MATVDAILEATARVLVARGYAGLTTNHVAERAGVSVGTLYEYFPGKEALVAGVIDRHVAHANVVLAERTAELAVRAFSMEPIEVARALATIMVELHEDDPRLHRVLTEEVPLTAEMRAHIRATEERMVQMLAAGIAADPRIRARDPAVAARMVVGLLEGATHRWATDRDGIPLPRDVLVTELATMIAAYLTTPAAAPTR